MTTPKAPTKEEKIQALVEQNTSVGLGDDQFRAHVTLYGDIGAGKTDLACKILNELCDTFYVLYSDSGWTTLLKYPEIAKKAVGKLPFSGMSNINTILDAREMGVEPFASLEGLLWDTASTSSTITMRNLVDQRKFPKSQYAPDIAGMPHYGLLEVQFVRIMQRLRESDLHVVYITHMRNPSEKEIENGRIRNRPNLPEAAWNVLGRESNAVGYMTKEVSGGQRFVQFSSDKYQVAKCQIPGIEEKTYKVEEIPPLLRDWANKR